MTWHGMDAMVLLIPCGGWRRFFSLPHATQLPGGNNTTQTQTQTQNQKPKIKTKTKKNVGDAKLMFHELWVPAAGRGSRAAQRTTHPHKKRLRSSAVELPTKTTKHETRTDLCILLWSSAVNKILVDMLVTRGGSGGGGATFRAGPRPNATPCNDTTTQNKCQ
jgi:hypothetical protein